MWFGRQSSTVDCRIGAREATSYILGVGIPIEAYMVSDGQQEQLHAPRRPADDGLTGTPNSLE